MRERIKALVHERGMTIKGVERRCGLKDGTIRRWDKHIPRADNLSAVAGVLGTTVEYLMGNSKCR